jgi:hypothetical protein
VRIAGVVHISQRREYQRGQRGCLGYRRLGPVEEVVEGQGSSEHLRLVLREHLWPREHLQHQLREGIFTRSFRLPHMYVQPAPLPCLQLRGSQPGDGVERS